MKRLALTAVGTLALTTATTGAPHALQNGLYGKVMKGPITPVCQVGVPCDGPAHVTLVFTRLGHSFRIHSASDGAYRIRLTPGIYAVRTVERIGIYPNIRPA